MGKEFFGTDGIRGRVGADKINPEFFLKLGWALGIVLAGDLHAKVVIGKDTRISGYMLESALEAGLSAAGVDTLLLGPMPTPGVAYLTRTFRASAGIAISASHNPFYDNGIKLFSSDGRKLSDALEQAIEAQLKKPMQCVASADMGKAFRVKDAAGRYIEFCKSTFPNQLMLNGMKLVVDAAHGAAYEVAEKVFHELGADVLAIGNQPDGLNINLDCGATDTKALQACVLREQADAGIALDGDADRLIMVDHLGEVVDGDELLGILACGLQKTGEGSPGVVGTKMTNYGLEQALLARDIPFKRADVGDRHVMEMLLGNNWFLGGESSGHLVDLSLTTTGDGIISALQILKIIQFEEKSLSELKGFMTKCPMQMENIMIEGDAKLVLSSPDVIKSIHDAEKALAGQGRVLVRASGTESKIRVMVEANKRPLLESILSELVAVVKAAL